MAYLFEIPYRDRHGKHVAQKWGETPAEALGFVQEKHARSGLGVLEYGTPVCGDPLYDPARKVGQAGSVPQSRDHGGVGAVAGELVLT